MNWEEWVSNKEKRYLGVIGFIIAYILTIPIRDYGFLGSFVDMTQGVPILAHIIIIIIGSILFLVFLTLIEIIIKSFLKKKKK